MSDKPLIGLTCRWEETNDGFYLSRDYFLAVAAAGGIPVQIPLLPEVIPELAARLDGFVLCGSPSDLDPVRYGETCQPEVSRIHPDRDETDRRVLEHAFGEKKPVLGICFGLQSLNVYLGGTLLQHIPASVPGALDHKNRQLQHPIRLKPDSRMAQWAGESGEVLVNSSHHQSVGRLGRNLRATARAADGVIEAVEGYFPGHFVVGVQWHPERIWETETLSARLFRELVEAARVWRRAAGLATNSLAAAGKQ